MEGEGAPSSGVDDAKKVRELAGKFDEHAL